MPSGFQPLPEGQAGLIGSLYHLYNTYGPKWMPWYERVRRLLPLFSLITGILSIVLFRRGVGYVRYMVMSLAIVWLVTVVLVTLTRAGAFGSRALAARKLADFIAQGLYQDTFCFLLPFYAASSVPSSSHALFLILLVGAALVSTFDPIYERWVLASRWGSYLFFAFSFFVALNFALPVAAGIPNNVAVFLGGVISVVLVPPMLSPWRSLLDRATARRALVGAILVGTILWFARPMIPPTPLKVVTGTFALGVDPATREPVGALESVDRRDLGRLFCYTSIFAPLGIEETIIHHWRHDEGPERDDIVLKNVHGGREEGFRTWTLKTNFGPHPEGHWTVDVRTAGGQLLGRLRLEVRP